MRGRRAFIVLTVHLLVVAGFAWMIATLAEQSFSSGFSGSNVSASAEIGRSVFSALIMLLTLIVLVLAPASTAGAISLEREKQTLDLLTTTPISSLAIILGKLLSALSWVFLLLLASIPVAALVFTFGGVGPEDLVRAYVDPVRDRDRVRLDGPVRVGVREADAGGDGHQPRGDDHGDRRGDVRVRLLVGDDRERAAAQRGRRTRRQPDRDADAAPARGAAVLQPVRRPARRDLRHGDRVRRHLLGHRGDHRLRLRGHRATSATRASAIDHDTFWPRAVAAMLITAVVLVILSVQLVAPTRRWRLRRSRPKAPAPPSPIEELA